MITFRPRLSAQVIALLTNLGKAAHGMKIKLLSTVVLGVLLS